MKKRGRDGRGKGECPGTDRETHDDLDDDAQLLLLPARRALAPRRRRAGGPSCRHRPARRAAAVGPACRAAAVGLAQPRPPRSHMPALLAAAAPCLRTPACAYRGRRQAELPSRISTMHTAHSGAFCPPPSALALRGRAAGASRRRRRDTPTWRLRGLAGWLWLASERQGQAGRHGGASAGGARDEVLWWVDSMRKGGRG